MFFTVYSSCVDEVVKRLDRLARKAKEYNISFGYSKSEEYAKEISIYKVDPADGRTIYEAGRRTVSAVDFDIDCDGFIKSNGWTVIARIEHGDIGNIVTPINNKPVLSDWYSLPAKCDHCNTNHMRKTTYIVEHESGAIRQVGRACLHDYTGISPATAALWAAVRDLFPQDLDCREDDRRYGSLEYMYSVVDIIAHAYESIKERGYIKTSYSDSTADKVLERINKGEKASAEAIEKAKIINDWLINDCGGDNAGDIERNCHILAFSQYAKLKHFGILAYMPVAYQNYLNRKAKEEAKRIAAEQSPSRHIGEIGERLTLNIKEAELITSWDNMYGRTYLYKFVNHDGNVLVWFGSKRIELSENMKIKATVKDHNERDGIKQTIITRCTVLK